MGTIVDNIHIAGNLSADSMTLANGTVTNAMVHAAAAIDRSKLAQDDLTKYAIPWDAFKVWNAYATPLANTASADDLGLIGGTWASASPMLQTIDQKNNTAATSCFARFFVALPAEYVTGETVQIRFNCYMVTTVASTTATVDLVAYESTKAGGIGSDLVTTSATSINSLTPANVDFTVNPAGLAAGDILDCRVDIAINDTATGTAVIGAIGYAALMCDVKG